MRNYLRSGIHCATVTHANLDYESSLSVDEELLAVARIASFEQVHAWNITRGSRLTTYATVALRSSCMVRASGVAAANLDRARWRRRNSSPLTG